MVQEKQRTILLIEADASLRWLIALGLKQQEIRVIEASSPAAISTLDIAAPDLLIIDIDNGIRADWELVAEARLHPRFADAPIVVLSWEPAPVLVPTSAALEQVAWLNKPFDARILHASVGQLLYERATQEAALTAKAEEALLAAYSTHTPPSIWPVVTAAGVLLALIGMMVSVLLVISGATIMLVALLLWTLGTPRSQQRAFAVQ